MRRGWSSVVLQVVRVKWMEVWEAGEEEWMKWMKWG